ncbi:MFS transporter [Acetobacter indonesiensis]|uniref:MFS transporter n=1 Tax=Acetobacter indonesiensis TaxID=104101 RepID=A0A252AJZ1_9PROT|nr:MFS transporter [Acetobacter indonesiensis]OUI89947.1 MFS transporter [Acetobacter indonesiensis]
MSHALQKETKIINKIAIRILPLATLCYLGAYIDRQNISFAKLQMASDLQISDTVFATGASLFFIGYMIFEIPSNMLLHKFGASRWITRIALSWGVITILMAYTKNISTFYTLRFFLGAAEAGLYPGIIYYLSLWFPSQHRVRMMGYFTLASSVGNMVSGPLCGWLLSLQGVASLSGWQIIFLITGIFPIILGILVYFFLPERPESQTFLSNVETCWLLDSLETERHAVLQEEPQNVSIISAVFNLRVMELAVCFMLISIASYGLSYWLPSLVNEFGVSYTTNGFLNAVPYFLSTLTLIFIVPALRKGERPLYAMLSASILGVLCFLLSVFVHGNSYRFIFLCLGGPCIYVLLPCLWVLPSKFLKDAKAAIGIATITSVGGFGAFMGQNLVAWVRYLSQSSDMPMIVPATACAVLCFMAVKMICSEKNKILQKK